MMARDANTDRETVCAASLSGLIVDVLMIIGSDGICHRDDAFDLVDRTDTCRVWCSAGTDG